MASSSSTAATARKALFLKRVDDVKIPKSDINTLILDYLTTEGYPNAAANFSKEANLVPHQDLASIRVRQDVQFLIFAGNIEGAVEALNDFDPKILEEDKALHFALLRLQLIELIRQGSGAGGDISVALKFATEQLAPRAPANPAFLEDLEQTMALLMFPVDSLDPQLARLLKPDLRREAADMVNRAMVQRQTQRRDAAIRTLFKMRAWAETKARDRGIALPSRLDIGLETDDSGHTADGASGNGHDAMLTT